LKKKKEMFFFKSFVRPTRFASIPSLSFKNFKNVKPLSISFQRAEMSLSFKKYQNFTPNRFFSSEGAISEKTEVETIKKGRRKKIITPPRGEGTPFTTEEGTPFIVDESVVPFEPDRELTPLERVRELLRKKKWEEVEQLFLKQAEKGEPFSKQDYHYLFENFSKTEKKIESFHNFLEQMVKYNVGGGPDTNTYYILMVSLAKRGSTDDVMWAFLDLLHRKFTPSTQILHFLIPKIFNKLAPFKKKKLGEGVIDTAGEAQADASFRRFLIFLRDIGVWPDPFVYQLIIKQCEVMGYPRTMLKYHDEMKAVEKLRVDLEKEKAQKRESASNATGNESTNATIDTITKGSTNESTNEPTNESTSKESLTTKDSTTNENNS